jgi:phosphoglycolate phosphatase
MIGDSRADIEAAKNADIPVVAVTFGYTDTPVADLSPDRIIDHFDALWDAVADLIPGHEVAHG